MAEIRSLTVLNDPALSIVADHFQAMYADLNVDRKIDDEGKAKWLHSSSRALDRTLFIEVAEQNGSAIASMHGTLLMTPSHLGGERVAMVQHIYVVPEHRKSGVAKELAKSWIRKMKKRSVEHFQLHVTSGNSAGLAFWKSLGFEIELSQLSLRTK